MTPSMEISDKKELNTPVKSSLGNNSNLDPYK